MATALEISVGQYSDRGRKAQNQDFHGLLVPERYQRSTKGIAIALADGISSSNVSQVASEAAVTGFLNDYFSTPDTWSVKQSAQRVLRATNAWLHAQTRQSQYRYDHDRGYVCTLSVMVLKSRTAHLFNVGDSRIYRVQGRRLEQLSTDHRLWLSRTESCLTRAMGMEDRLDLAYRQTSLAVGDLFVLATDGIYEHLPVTAITDLLRHHGTDLSAAAEAIGQAALAAGSTDNLTVQILRIDQLPEANESAELHRELSHLPFAGDLTPGQVLDGYRIVRQLHASGRSHVFLAVDEASQTRVVLKVPSTDLRDHPGYLEQFAAEDWIARRIHNSHVVRPFEPERPRSRVYLVTDFIEGRTLKQWLLDHPSPALETVRGLVEQIGRGLRAFHRLEMVHQDLKPENVLVDADGRVTLIDFGATRVAGLQELSTDDADLTPRGAALYAAPELFLGEPASWRSDQFSLAVITYQLLTGRLPYQAEVPKIRSRAQLRRLTYQPARPLREDVPVWVDQALARALHPDAHRRYPALSEFLHDLRQPGADWHRRHRPPLITRHPVTFWQSVSALLLLALLAALALG